MNLPIYLDNNATTPMDPRVLDAMMPYFTNKFGNAASRNHHFGWVAEEAVDYAREQVAKLIGANEKEIIFTSGTTAGINLLAYVFEQSQIQKGDEILISALEHHSNIVPWQMVCKKTGANLRVAPITVEGELIEIFAQAHAVELIAAFLDCLRD